MLTVIRWDMDGTKKRKEIPIDKLTHNQQEIFRTVVKVDGSSRSLDKSHLYEKPCYIVEFDGKVVCDVWSSNGIWINAFVNDVLE